MREESFDEFRAEAMVGCHDVLRRHPRRLSGRGRVRGERRGIFCGTKQAVFEALPRDLEDWKLVGALPGEPQTLRAVGKREAFKDAQKTLF
jgi:hypothetical protein